MSYLQKYWLNKDPT